jgi:pyrroloquinoline quinone biosynthesis protein B
MDSTSRKWWLFEATPDIKEQFNLFHRITGNYFKPIPDAIFITHAHMGHYTGLMHLGREAYNAHQLPVYVMPRLQNYLQTNGPWSQLVALKNIQLRSIAADVPVELTPAIRVEPWLVPHRDEFSETVGFKIASPSVSYLFIPDIDKWSLFSRNIVTEVAAVDVAFLDATFYSADEPSHRKISEIPHPLVTETINLFVSEPVTVKKKIYFIHFNHTNPLLFDAVTQEGIRLLGFTLAEQGRVIRKP